MRLVPALLLASLLLPACGEKEGDRGDKRVESYPDVTPLVLRFGDDPLAFLPADPEVDTARFEIEVGGCGEHDWPAPETPWLVRDRDGNGQIDDGSEMFGSGVTLADGQGADHGFQALAELDENGDGRVDGQDPEYAELLLWSDWNLDRRTDDGELTSLREAGVHVLYLGYREGPECDDRGNCGIQRSRFVGIDGVTRTRGDIIDVYLPCREL